MKNKLQREKLLDYGKNILICLLLVSSVFLIFKTVIYEPEAVFARIANPFSGDSGKGSGTAPESETVTSAAEPMFMLITTGDGSHYAAKYDSTNKSKLLSQFTSSLGEALGSSDSAMQISEPEWQNALQRSGVFFDYLYPQPLSAMASWLGTEIDGNAAAHTARRLFLGGSDNNALYLYYINETDYSIYRCKTALSFSALSDAISVLPIGNSHFAFELGEEYKSLDPYFIFSEESSQLRAISASNPLKDGFPGTALLELFQMNSRTCSETSESDSSKVYVDGNKSLSIDVSGKVSFSVTGSRGIEIPSEGSELKIEDCIRAANAIIQSSVKALSGDAALGLSKISGMKSPASCTLSFSYSVAGIPVSLPNDAYAVSVQIGGGTIIRMDMLFRQYSYTGEHFAPMPEKMAAAIAKLEGGEPVLRYDDRTSGISCSWITN